MIRTQARSLVVALVVGDLIALAWIAIAFLREGVTFHLAPLIVTVVPAAVLRLDKRPTATEGWAPSKSRPSGETGT